jgi:hypothetical protein
LPDQLAVAPETGKHGGRGGLMGFMWIHPQLSLLTGDCSHVLGAVSFCKIQRLNSAITSGLRQGEVDSQQEHTIVNSIASRFIVLHPTIFFNQIWK